MDNTNNSCCCGETEHFSGCLICGAPVTYSVESSVKTCSICHKEQLTNAVCENGHFVCDACHSYGTYIPVIIALRSSTEKDPLLLLEEIMDLPSVHMHGPEHHAIVPSVLLTALRNNGERGESLAQMALKWILRDGIVTSVLIGASRPQQILENLKVLDSESFSEEELKKIDECSLAL